MLLHEYIGRPFSELGTIVKAVKARPTDLCVCVSVSLYVRLCASLDTK